MNATSCASTSCVTDEMFSHELTDADTFLLPVEELAPHSTKLVEHVFAEETNLGRVLPSVHCAERGLARDLHLDLGKAAKTACLTVQSHYQMTQTELLRLSLLLPRLPTGLFFKIVAADRASGNLHSTLLHAGPPSLFRMTSVLSQFVTEATIAVVMWLATTLLVRTANAPKGGPPRKGTAPSSLQLRFPGSQNRKGRCCALSRAGPRSPVANADLPSHVTECQQDISRER